MPALAGLALLSSEGLGQQTDDPVTYAKDVAPLIQANCQVCHRPGSVAPMSLLEYEDVRTYAPLIKERVASRTMPPWHIDRTVGIREFKNDISPDTPETPQTPPPGTPIFELDPSWPTVPDQWILGEVSSIGVAAPDRLLLLHRPRSAPADERHMAAPPVLEFDIAGNFLRAWGGAGDGYEWPEREHGIDVDYRGNVWIGGNNCPERNLPGLKPASDDQLLKFSGDGRFLMQIGRSNRSSGSSDSRNVRQAGDQAVYPRTNEVFVADGYGNRRVIVFDADTGEFKRMWGAFGNEPIDYYGCPPPSPGARSEGDDPPQFLIVHAITISNDGFVYVADREYGRIQIFTIDGEFVDQTFMPRNASGNARAGDMAFSADPQQEFMYVAAGAQIVVIRRRSLEILYSFSGSGHHIATDSEGNLYTAQTRQRRAQKYVFQGLSAGDGR